MKIPAVIKIYLENFHLGMLFHLKGVTNKHLKGTSLKFISEDHSLTKVLRRSHDLTVKCPAFDILQLISYLIMTR